MHVTDSGEGVDAVSLVMTVAGAPVTPIVTGSSLDFTLTYNPSSDFGEGEIVMVTVDACDLAVPAKCMVTEEYSFTIGTLPVVDVWYLPYVFK